MKRDRGLPLGVYIKKGEKTYQAKLTYKKKPVIIGRYHTVEAASAAVIAKKKELRDAELAAHNAIPIERNEDGIAVIPVRNAAGEIVKHALVSDDDWHRLTLCSWNMDDGYPIGTLDGISRKMHQHLLPGQACIDHFNQVRHDNRRENLRGSDYSHNNQNRPKKEGCSSKYVGVEASGKYWVATIRKDNKKEFLGSYMTEDEAARAYNVRAMELYDRPQLNMVADVVGPVVEPAILEGLGNRKKNGSSSRYLGVYKSHKKWAVAMIVKGKTVRVGRYAEEKDAARAYNEALDQFGLDKRRNNVST